MVIISEDAGKDVSAFRAANDILHKLIHHLMHANPANHYGFQGKRFSDGRTFLTLRGADIGLEDDPSLWFCFGVITGYSTDGNISKFKRSGEQVITINCLDDAMDTDKAAHIIIHRHIVHDVLLHELIHYLDSKRYPGFHEKGSDKEHGAAYYNNPKEFNAYFTNLATPLLNFLQMPASDRLPNVAKGMGISSDFQTTLAMLIKRATTSNANGAILGNFLKHLDQRNRRALLKRLYGLHQQVIQRLAVVETQRICQLAGLNEGELIPFPERLLRISGAALDFYQLLKMAANPNLAHKVNYKQTSTDVGTNLTEVVMCFYDEVSFKETKALFDHYGIVYTEEAEVAAPMEKSPFKSKLNPPTDGDILHGGKTN